MAANASVQVDAADPFGILITNGEFTSFVDSKFGQQVFQHKYEAFKSKIHTLVGSRTSG